MERKNSTRPVARVVREGKPSKRRKKPLTKGQRIAKTIFAAIGKVLLTSFLVMVITGCIVGTALTIYVMQYVDSEPEIKLTEVAMTNSGQVYGINASGENELVQRLSRGENREWVNLDHIPKNLQNAFVYFEDERFWEHEGVDFKRTFGAVLNELMSMLHIGSESTRFGGSTITQQLIKNINGDIYNRSVEVKIKEIMQAMNMERHYSKEQILEAYLNCIGLHYNTVGVQAGAKYYFGKDVSELSLAECASLAVITKSPASYNPIDHPDNNKARRDRCLKKMLEFGCITQEEYAAAVNTPVETAKTPVTSGDNSSSGKKVQSWFVDAVIERVIKDLAEKYDYTSEHAEEMLYTGGLTVYSTMEIETQSRMEAIFENSDNFKVAGYTIETMPQASMVIMDYNGNVCGLIGGTGEKTGARLFNRATRATRAFGSTIKPLSVYTSAIEQDLVTWSTVMMDEPVMQIKDEETGQMRDWPNNYTKRYDGPMTIVDAVRSSKNTIPVELIQSLSAESAYDYLRYQLGFRNIKETQVGPDGLALGGAACTTLELTAAYQIFGNGGYYIEPTLYSKVVDRTGKVLLDRTNRSKKQVMSSQTATIMNRLLWEVVNNGGTGTRAASSTWEVVGKSGTSNNYKDLGFAGLTPHYVAAIRYGYDEERDENGNEIEISTKIGRHDISLWKKVMDSVQAGKPAAKFELNMNGVVRAQYCTESGMLASGSCKSTKWGYYKESNLPDECTACGKGSSGVSHSGTVSAIQ